MYIEPRTNIRLIRNSPVDPDYTNTLYFTSPAEQTSYFVGLTKYNLENYSYQRVNRGTIRVGIKAENLYDINYMMFQNTSFGNKWFYAFVNKIEYVNDTTSELTFTIDVMQTWFFDHSPNKTFVEREHSATDWIGDNIVPESLSLGEYVFNDYKAFTDVETGADTFKEMCIVLMITDVESTTVDGKMYDGIYGASTLFAYNTSVAGIRNLNEKIGSYAQSPDSINGIYMCPKALIPLASDTGYLIPFGGLATARTKDLPQLIGNETLDGYRPKNMKMYTYPYNYVHVDNANGNALSLCYEFFKNNTPNFVIEGVITQPVTLTLRPKNYKGQSERYGAPFDSLNTESLSITSYPMCSWNMDAYHAWVAQNSVPMALGIGAGAINLATSTAVSRVSTMIQGAKGVNFVTDMLSQYYQASIQADISKGSQNNGGVNTANGKQQFYVGRASVNHEIATIIDDYFTRYGYATKKLKVPNRSVRPHWTYVKTVGCTIRGSVPADDEIKICEIYDNGITFWNNGNEVGNYDLNNSPVLEMETLNAEET